MTYSTHKEGDILQIHFCVIYSTKQGTTHRPRSHLAHLDTVPFLWLREEHRQQHSWVDDFAGQCLLWWLLLRLAAAAAAAVVVVVIVVVLLLLLLHFLLLLLLLVRIVFNITSLSTWSWVGVSNQNFTDGFLLKFYFFFRSLLNTTIICLVRLLCMTGHSCRNVIRVRYERLLQWQQNRSKAMMWLLYKIPAIWGCPRRCY